MYKRLWACLALYFEHNSGALVVSVLITIYFVTSESIMTVSFFIANLLNEALGYSNFARSITSRLI